MAILSSNFSLNLGLYFYKNTGVKPLFSFTKILGWNISFQEQEEKKNIWIIYRWEGISGGSETI